ncbi:MAG: hypothetical protein AAGJ18_16775 [Bacteroidota bacterium]
MDHLKKHIHKNRTELDQIEQPNRDKIWSNIQQELNPIASSIKVVHQPKGRRFTPWAMATAASLALLIGVGVGYLFNPKSTETIEFNLANYAPELEKAAADYRQLVAAKKSELNFQELDTLAFGEVLQELKELNQEYDHWTKDVPQYVQEQELLEFLQRHYEQKIRILELLAKEIEKKEYYEERAIRL